MGHACYLHRLVPKFHACFMHVPCMKNMHISCMKLACSRQIPCVVQAYSKHDTAVFHAWYRRSPCVVQAYSKHDTGVFHAWYRQSPCMIQAYSMRGTGVFHSYVHRAQYSYKHINPWIEYLCRKEATKTSLVRPLRSWSNRSMCNAACAWVCISLK